MKTSYSLIAAASAWLCSLSLACADQKLPVWTPSPALTAQLGSETKIQNYSLRLPVGYSEISLPPEAIAKRQDGFDMHAYSMPNPTNGTNSMIVAIIAKEPDGLAKAVPLPSLIEGYIHSKRKTWLDFKLSQPEFGFLNGGTFSRAYFGGTYHDASKSADARGFIYVAQDGRKLITLVAEAGEPKGGPILANAEAAIQTFHVAQ